MENVAVKHDVEIIVKLGTNNSILIVLNSYQNCVTRLQTLTVKNMLRHQTLKFF